MKIRDFIKCIKNRDIPPEPPDLTAESGSITDFMPHNAKDLVLCYQARRQCLEVGMWSIVDKIWTKKLSDWIGRRKVLEVMAGGGWTAKALHEFGVNVVVTDDFSWTKSMHKGMKPVFTTMKKIDAVKAAKEIDADILLVSWPPHDDPTIIKVCNTWGTKRPIIYIGEPVGGCTAHSNFFIGFKPIKRCPAIPLMCWPGLHDFVDIGFWKTVKDIKDLQKIFQ